MIAGTIALAIPTGRFAARVYESYQSRPIQGSYQAYMNGKGEALSLYGTGTCPACKLARDHLKNAGIPFNDLLIDAVPELRTEWASLQQDSVPVLLSKNTMLVGYREEQYRRLLTPQKISN
ncbi:glutaredoxin family protein [Roseateles sp. BYS180W]|uniref:Glutaredoxin family protein n=1 Tax=Roseateles rivi TaxID=3299028 RepID=A0ABW7FTD6_9BURK